MRWEGMFGKSNSNLIKLIQTRYYPECVCMRHNPTEKTHSCLKLIFACILILSTPNVWIKTVFTLTHLSKVWCLLRLSGLSQSSQLKRISWLSLVPPSFLEPAPAPPPSPRAVYLSGWCRGRGLLSQEHEIDECVRSKPRMELHGKWYEGKGGSSIREAGKLGGDTSPMVNGTLSHLFYGSYFKPGGSN